MKTWFLVPSLRDHLVGLSPTSPSAFSISFRLRIGIWFAIFIGANLLFFARGGGFVSLLLEDGSPVAESPSRTVSARDSQINTIRKEVLGIFNFKEGFRQSWRKGGRSMCKSFMRLRAYALVAVHPTKMGWELDHLEAKMGLKWSSNRRKSTKHFQGW